MFYTYFLSNCIHFKGSF